MSSRTQEDLRASIVRAVGPVLKASDAPANLLDLALNAGGSARLVVEVESDDRAQCQALEQALEARLREVDGIMPIQIVITNIRSQAGGEGAQNPARRPPAQMPRPEGLGAILAIGSGKGGVGKSTLAANLAVALAASGYTVGLLDADVYGPSQVRMFGLETTNGLASQGADVMIPPARHGVKVMSMGLLIDDARAVIWRGPMLMKAVRQLLHQVAWAPCDLLLVDLPPGTGDVQLTFAQSSALDGAVIVSTPQDVALMDARKAIDLFRRLDVPILGMVENMSGFRCPQCGTIHAIFKSGGAMKEAQAQGIEALGQVPLDETIALAGDAGIPSVMDRSSGSAASPFTQIARRLAERLNLTRSAAKIEV